MQDTSDDIYKIQHDIFMKKSLKERFLLNIELTEFDREMTRRRIIKVNIGISEKELKAKIFREYYSDEFSEDEIIKITELF